MVAPDLQGRSLGRRLLAAIEATADLPRAELFSGAASTGNRRFYERNGYRQLGRVTVVGVEVVRLGKELRAQPSSTGSSDTP